MRPRKMANYTHGRPEPPFEPVQPDSDGSPFVTTQEFQWARPGDFVTWYWTEKMVDNTPNPLSAVLQVDSKG